MRDKKMNIHRLQITAAMQGMQFSFPSDIDSWKLLLYYYLWYSDH